ncbi:unnamed protein product [Ilex paraguariensis]|uniref:GST C-terminal domain-containing protein n=1 Tax=Ilex paraguariensis TaxID=185542 RepID=A0ABC8U1Y8_9AQUA
MPLLPSVWQTFIKQGTKQEEAIDPAMENLKLVEEQLKGKIFFGGEKIDFLDLAFGWIANFISVLQEVTGQKVIDSEKFPLLSAWMEKFSDDPVINECGQPRDRLSTKFKAMREAYLAAATPK